MIFKVVKNLIWIGFFLSLAACDGGDFKSRSCSPSSVKEKSDCGNATNKDFQTDVQAFDLTRNENDLLELDIRHETTWSKQHPDEGSRALSISNDSAFVATFWHNRVIAFQLNEDGTANEVGSKKIAYVAGGRDDVDAATGATEKQLTHVLSDHNATLSGVVVLFGTSAHRGVYLSAVNNRVLEDDVVYSQQSLGENFIPNAKIKTAAFSYGKNGGAPEWVAVGGRDESIKLYKVGSIANTAATKTLNVGMVVSAVTFSKDNGKLYVAGYHATTNAGMLKRFDVSTLTQEFEWAQTKSKILHLGVANHTIAIASSTDIFVIDDSDTSNLDTKRVEAKASINSMALNESGSVLAYRNSSVVERIDIATGKRWVRKISALQLGFDQWNNLWAMSSGKLTSFATPL